MFMLRIVIISAPLNGELGVSENHSHRMVHVWKGPVELIYSNLPAQAGSPRAHYSGLCPDSFQISPEKETL